MKFRNLCSQSGILTLIVSLILGDLQVVTSDARSAMAGRKLVLMSMDGFRHDYLQKTDTPNFDRLLAAGVSAPYVNLTFATLTFPCHYTIVTGRYEESHGIVANSMYDPEYDATFTMKNTETRWWNGAEPIWTNAVRAGLKIGVYFWVGSEAEIGGIRPTRYRKYDWRVPFESRVDTVIDWLSKDDFDAALIYFNEPDHSGHQYGPESPKMIPVIHRMDNLLGYFLDKLEVSGLKDKTDFILTSDHGMTTVLPDKEPIYISDHVDSAIIKDVVASGALVHIIPQEGKAQEVVAALSGVKHIKVYQRKDIPEHFHYKNHRRIMPVVVFADEGYVIVENKNSRYTLNGTHGYSNDLMSMKPILMATGPSMATNVTTDVVRSVDIYPLLCRLLHLKPAPNNGSLERIKDFLRSGGTGSQSSTLAALISATAGFFIALILPGRH